jgi:hypothetical protein
MSYLADLAELEREEAPTLKLSPPPQMDRADRLGDFKEREGADMILEPKFT